MEAIMKKALGFFALVVLTSVAFATPANTPTLDGRPIEYDSADLMGTFYGASTWGANGTLTNLYVTWDSTYIYIALQAWQAGNNKLVVLLDVDPGAGTGATTTTNWTSVEPSFIKYNDYGWADGSFGFGLDYMLASEGTYNNCIRISYDGVETPSTNNMESLFDRGNGATPAGTPIDMASVNDATACPHKGFEARIPWTNLFAGTRFGTVEAGEIVPRNATLHLLAGIHNNNPDSAYSSPDTIPNQAVENYINGIVTSADYVGVGVDNDGNGIPDIIAGDHNAPYIRAGAGAVGGSSVYLAFNEPVTAATVQNNANWTVGGATPLTAVAQGAYGVLLGLATPIADTNLVLIRASGVQDAALNSRVTEYCLAPAASGISQAITVTFQVNTNSGMGISATHPKPAAFFINGSALPLEWGYPPLETTPLTPIPGSNGWAAASVTFPPGSPSELFYKYSGRINGTNNYEAIRLTDFSSASRKLILDTNSSTMTVQEYLGAAAHPLRNPGDTNLPSAHYRLYQDPQRGDAGVRVRREILFQLDLSLRKRDNLQRVFVAGSDPLRGFNDTGNVDEPPTGDFPGTYVNWNVAGVELFDDGTHGDTTMGDGIYSRLWAFSTNGLDSASEPGLPYSLVGGDDFTEPYVGTWLDRRSPRSLIYKFYVLTDANNHYESPSSNLEYYMLDPADPAQIVLNSFLWDNEDIPPPPAENAPVVKTVAASGTTATVQFENILTEGAHGVKISTNLLNGFTDYGLRADRVSTNDGVAQWSASIGQISPVKEYYAPYAGLEPEPTPLYWQPNIIPATATTWRVYFSQFKTNLKGMRSMNLTGNFTGWTEGLPMTFLGNGLWMIDVELPVAADGSGLAFKTRGGPGYTWLSTGDYKAVRGTGGATWAPIPPVPGELFTVTLDVAGTPLAAATNVNIHLGFDNWKDTAGRAMTNTVDTVWEYAVSIPTNYSVSVDWVFNNGGATWYSAGDWRAFMAPYYSP
jgi:hypothetical protein